MKNNRRNFIKWSGLSGFGIGLAPSLVLKAKAEKQSSHLMVEGEANKPPHRLPSMIQNYYIDKVREISKKHSDRIYGLKTKKDALEYQAEIKNKIKDCLGPFPEKIPLNPVITGKLEREGFTVEKVIYESRPGFKVTANLYIPKNNGQPMPAVLGTCGHTREAKSSAYQYFAQSLARKGYVVLIIDCIGQGERLQYPTPGRESATKWGVTEHIYAGNPLTLVGDSMAGWFVWDAIRGIDYLCSRPEVDHKYIGVTGNSGGGTQTTWLCGVEPRLTMAAPSCFVTTIRRNLENQEVQDAEQYAPKGLAKGLDHFDFIAAMAPKPVILITQEKDFFDTRGTQETFEMLQHYYKLLGAEENIQLFRGDDYHGYHQPAREAMYGFFNQVTKISNDGKEPEFELEKDEDLWCTPAGQLSKDESKTIPEILKKQSIEIGKKRGTVSSSNLKKALVEALRLPEKFEVSDYRIYRARKEPLFPRPFVTDMFVETERGIHNAVYKLTEENIYSRPHGSPQKVILYVSHLEMDDELINDEKIREILSDHSDHAIYTCDLRGIGQTESNTHVSYSIPYNKEYFYGMLSNMMGEPLIGKRTYDLLCILNWLESLGHTEITILGNGWGCQPATFASVLNENVKKVILKNALSSYSDIAESTFYNWPVSAFPMNVLNHFDLPDCYLDLKRKNLEILGMWDAQAGEEK
ncbi:alpha/beta hydrolase family protein [Cyclobacterium qasimii]|uniref:Xylan esterase n=2 Tax=Cyclobacterium qasimii TaxID=1350429 RepID=A0A512CBZ9_9BACT|nr:acetylxylan esterase [Cyclobacterium qasimii]GEO21640.1 xylan esterase [Cyclobacterium qasimii]